MSKDVTVDVASDNTTAYTINVFNSLDNGSDDLAGTIFLVVMLLMFLCFTCYYSCTGTVSACRTSFRKCRHSIHRTLFGARGRELWNQHTEAVVQRDAAAARDGSAALLGVSAADDPLEMSLAALVGLDTLKEEIRALRRSLVVDRQRRKVTGAARSKGFQGAPHMIFMGSPGTGKTQSARLIAKLLKELRYVDGPLIEVQRADLVAGFVGQTALKTREVVNRAKGGVLFIGECCGLRPH
uniref:ATPase AAA-type core domain-containing protein n=1 Tax=Florenciella parvula TaxID=236787 RepID=A0A7S2FR53_9STRA